MSLRRISRSTFFLIASVGFVLTGTAWIGFAVFRFFTEPGLDAAQMLPEPLFALFLGILSQRGAQAWRKRERLYGVLARPGGAIERKQDLKRITRILLRTHDQTPQAAIVGLAGTGKTTLALQIVYKKQIINEFRDGILWLQVDQLPDTRAILHKIAQHVTKSEPEPRQTDEEYAVDLRSTLGGKRALVILDDLPPKMGEGPDLDLLLGLPCAILITSQYEELGLEEKDKVTLTELSPQEWMTLLARKLAVKPSAWQDRLGRWPIYWTLLGWRRIKRSERDAASRIWSAVEGLPLALSIVASDLASRPSRDLTAYAVDLEERRQKLEKLHRGKRKKLSVRISLDVSYDRLEGRDPQRFSLLAMRNGPDLPLPFVASLWGEAETDALVNLTRLKWRSLLELLGEERWRLHTLVREYANERLNDWHAEVIEAGGRLAGYYAAYAEEHGERDLSALEAEWADLQHAMNWAMTASNHSAAIQLALLTRTFFNSRRDWSTKCSWLMSGLEAAERSNHRSEQLELLDALGELYMSSGACGKAREPYQRAAELLESNAVLIDQQRLGKTLQQLGEVDTWLGLYSAALGNYRKAHGIYQQMRDMTGQTQVLSRIFRLLVLQRKYQEAIRLYQGAYGRALEGMPEDHAERARLILDHGIAAEIQGDYRKAREKYTETVDSCARHDRKCELSEAYRWLGRQSYRKGEYREARVFCLRAASISRSIPDLLGYVRMLEEIAQVARSEHRLDQAQSNYDDVRRWCVPVSNRGSAGELCEARPDDAGTTRWQEFVDYRPGVLHISGAQAELAYLERDLGKAEKQLVAALDDYGRWGVEELWWKARALHLFARVEESLNRLQVAQMLYRQASAAYQKLQEPWWQAEATYHCARLAQMQSDLGGTPDTLTQAKTSYLTEAKTAYQEAADLFGGLNQRWWQAELACQAASIAERLDASAEACHWYGIATDAYDQEQALYQQAQAGLRAAQAAELAGDSDSAHAWYRRSANAYKNANQPWNESEAAYQAACLAEKLGLISEARTWYQRAHRLYDYLGEPWWRAEAAYRSARLAEDLASPSEARQWYQLAAGSYQQLGESWRQVEATYRAERLVEPQQSLSIAEEPCRHEPDAVPPKADPAVLPQTAGASCLVEAEEQHRRDARGFARLGKTWGQAEASFRTALMADLQGSLVDAKRWYEEASVVYRQLEISRWQADATDRVAHLAEQLDDCVGAEQWYERALELYQGLKESWRSIDVMENLARLMERTGSFEKAVRWYESQSNACKRQSRPNWQAAASFQAARVAEQVDDLTTAAKHYYTAANGTWRRPGKVLWEVEAAWRAARLSEQLGHLAQALEGYQRVATIYQEMTTLGRTKEVMWRQAEVIYRAARIATKLSRLADAKEQYERALLIFQECEEPWWQAEVAYQVASLSDLLGHLKDAEEKYKSARRIYEKELHDQTGRIRSLSGLGKLAIVQENLAKAEGCLNDAALILENSTDQAPEEQVVVDLGLAELALAKEDLTRAKQKFEAALGCAEHYRLSTQRAEALLGLGRVATAKRDFSRAREDLEESLALCESIGDRARQARVLNALGRLALTQLNYSEAHDYIDHALTLTGELGMLVELARALVVAGHLAIAEVHHDLASQYLRAAQQLFNQLGLPRREAEVLSQLGEAALSQKDYNEAERWLQRALNLYRSFEATSAEIRTALRLAEVAQALEFTPLAIQRCEQALEICGSLGDKDCEQACVVDVYHDFAQILECYGQFELAADYCVYALREAMLPGQGLPPVAVHQSLKRIAQAMGKERLEKWYEGQQIRLAALGVSL